MSLLNKCTVILLLLTTCAMGALQSQAEGVISRKLSTKRNTTVVSGNTIRLLSVSSSADKKIQSIQMSVQPKKKKAKRITLRYGKGGKRLSLVDAGTLDLWLVERASSASKVAVVVNLQPQSFCSSTNLDYSLLNAKCESYVPSISTSSVVPQPLNIDFGVWIGWCSLEVGAAAVGGYTDFWNSIGIPWCDHHTQEGLRFASGSISPIGITLDNLGGGWASSASVTSDGTFTDGRISGTLNLKGTQYGLGLLDPMLDSYGYPQDNQSGDATITLYNVPQGAYSLYLYGRTSLASQYGDYRVTVGERDYGRLQTSSNTESPYAKSWQEGNQYVRFSIFVNSNERVAINIQPGGEPFFNPIINGLQLVPISR